MLKRLITMLQAIWQQWWSRRSETTRSLPPHIWQAMMNYANRGSRQAAALAYYAIFSVFPLTLLLAVAIGGLVGPAVAQQQIADGLSLFLPETTVEAIRETLASAIEQNSQFGFVAAAGLIWSALGLFSNITWALDSIFDVPAIRSLWRQRLLAVLMGLTLVILVITSFVTSGVLRLFSVFLLDRPNVWVSIGTLFLPFGLDVAIFALLFRYVPARDVHWDAVWPAAMIGAAGWEVAKSGFEWYLSNVNTYSVIYGGIATGIVLLFWAYLIASVFLFSAELCARLNEWFIEQEEHRLAEQPQRPTLYFHAPAPMPPDTANRTRPPVDKPHETG